MLNINDVNVEKMKKSSKVSHPLKDSHRSGIVGNENGTGFIVGFENRTGKVPERLQKYSLSKPTKEEIELKQQAAAARRKKLEETKARQTRTVSHEAIESDRKVQAQGPLWIQQALNSIGHK